MYLKELISLLLKNTQYENLLIKEVEFQGHDNRTYKLGDDFCIRIPSHMQYNKQIIQMSELLQFIKVSIKIPNILYIGENLNILPFKYAVSEWIDGHDLKAINLYKLSDKEIKYFIDDLVNFMHELYNIKIDISHPIIQKYISNMDNFYRGNHISIYKDEFDKYLEKYKDYLNDHIYNKVKELFYMGLESKWNKEVVFVHGDLMPGNILLENHKLKAIIDWGSMGIGDPACDLIICWLYFNKNERDYFKNKLNMDENTWNRGISWTLWKCLANINFNTVDLQTGIKIIKNIVNDI